MAVCLVCRSLEFVDADFGLVCVSCGNPLDDVQTQTQTFARAGTFGASLALANDDAYDVGFAGGPGSQRRAKGKGPALQLSQPMRDELALQGAVVLDEGVADASQATRISRAIRAQERKQQEMCDANRARDAYVKVLTVLVRAIARKPCRFSGIDQDDDDDHDDDGPSSTKKKKQKRDDDEEMKKKQKRVEKKSAGIADDAEAVWQAYLSKHTPEILAVEPLPITEVRVQLTKALSAWCAVSAVLCAHWMRNIPILAADVQAALADGTLPWISEVDESLRSLDSARRHGLDDVRRNMDDLPIVSRDGVSTFAQFATIVYYQSDSQDERNMFIERNAMRMLPEGAVPPYRQLLHRIIKLATLPPELYAVCDRLLSMLIPHVSDLGFCKKTDRASKSRENGVSRSSQEIAELFCHNRDGGKCDTLLFDRPHLLIGAIIVTAARLSFASLHYKGLLSWELPEHVQVGNSFRIVTPSLAKQLLSDGDWHQWYRKFLAQVNNVAGLPTSSLERLGADCVTMIVARARRKVPAFDAEKMKLVPTYGSREEDDEAAKVVHSALATLRHPPAPQHLPSMKTPPPPPPPGAAKQTFVQPRPQKKRIDGGTAEERTDSSPFALFPMTKRTYERRSKVHENKELWMPNQDHDFALQQELPAERYDAWNVSVQRGTPYYHVLRAVGICVGAHEWELHRNAAAVEAILPLVQLKKSDEKLDNCILQKRQVRLDTSDAELRERSAHLH